MIDREITVADLWKVGLVLIFYPVIIIGSLDVWLKVKHKGTITASTRLMSAKYPIIPFLFGMLFGGLAVHFFLYG